MTVSRRFAMALVLAGCAPLLRAAPPEPVPGPPPQQLIETAARSVLQALDAERELVRRDPARVRRLVDELLLPHFDTDYAARLVLGRHWRAATPEQRQRFTEAFYQSLLRTYGASIADFTADRLTMLPFRGDLASGQAIVRSEVRRDDGTRVPVYYTLRATPAGWKAWDVTIEGISWVRNLRNDVGAEVEQQGLEALISRLEAENRQAGGPDAAS